MAVLPAVLVLLIAIHFWRIRKDGGLSRPEEPKRETQTETIVATMTLEPAKKRVYGLQGFVRGPFTKVGNVPDDTVYTWPNLLLAELFVFVLTVSLILLVSLAVQRAARTAGQRHAPAQSGQGALVFPRAAGDGQLLGLLGRHRHSRADGGAAAHGPVPRPRHQAASGSWFAKERLLANTLFLTLVVLNVIFIIIGTFFRGPNWTFVSPF